ncbi:MAG: hypothetical protein REI11_21455, partial [Patulibacter sp.]|nr:hypothetical protein [Patulibacter sp.]
SAPTYTFTATRAGATFECAYDGAPFAPCTSPWTPALPADGEHDVRVRATVGGLTDPTPAVVHVVVDTVAPTAAVTIGAAPGGVAIGPGVWAGPISIRIESSDAAPSSGKALVGCALDPPAVPTTADAVRAVGCPSQTDAPGDHVVYGVAVDAAGNESVIVSSRFQILSDPDTVITGGPTGTSWTTTPTFTFASSVPGSTFRCQVDHGPVVACASGFTLPVQTVGGHVFSVAAVGPTGAVDRTPAVQTFAIGGVETKALACEVQHWKTSAKTKKNFVNGCTVEPAGHACSLYEACTQGAPVCPVGARCTYTSTAKLTLDGVNFGTHVHAYVAPQVLVNFAKAARTIYVTGGDPPVALAECSRSTSGGDCPRSTTGTVIGDGTAPYLVCAADAYNAPPANDPYARSSLGPNQTVACDWSMRIEAAATVVPVVSGAGFSTYVPGPGTVTAAPAGNGGKGARLATAARAPKRAGKTKGSTSKTAAPFKALTVTAKAAGPVAFRPVLSKTARATYRRTGKLALRVTLTFTPQTGTPVTATTTITLRQAKALPKTKPYRGR